eukprot:scaffold102226_cov20-Tisochrysis_lutea.AAC.1
MAQLGFQSEGLGLSMFFCPLPTLMTRSRTWSATEVPGVEGTRPRDPKWSWAADVGPVNTTCQMHEQHAQQ